MSKIKQIFKPLENKKNFYQYVQDFRNNFVPKRYNQIELVNNLLDDDIDHYISISNRADGKSFNYLHFFMKLSYDYDVGFTFLVRHHTLQQASRGLFQKIVDTFPHFDPKHFFFMRTDFYLILVYRDKQLGIITDLNKASDLKLQSNDLQNFPIIIYDEFLALEGDYVQYEWEKLKTIYSSINREEQDIPIIKIPKIFYLGNAVNFSSPVLANLDIFNILEKHPMNTSGKYNNIMLEFNKNHQANEIRNLRAFKEENDNMTHGEFEVNNHNIASENERNLINKNPDYVYIKLENDYLKITYNKDTYDCILAIIPYTKDYNYNLLIKDNSDTSVFLNDNFYDEYHVRKYDNDLFLFNNNYSKNQILGGSNNLQFLNIHKIIADYHSKNNEDGFERNEKVYKENYIENTKKALYNRFYE